jgi:ribosomal protein S18 acetylase RimI-like enzyme
MEHCYWIMEGDVPIGFGQIHDGTLLSVAALQKGAGERCICALAATDSTPSIRLLCAMENHPAMRLYDRLGFSHGPVKERWYEITHLTL